MTRLIELIYSALDRPDKWKVFLDEFRTAIHVHVANFNIHYPVHSSFSICVFSGISDEDIREYHSAWPGQDPWSGDGTSVYAMTPGHVYRGEELVSEEVLESLPVYQQFLKHKGLHHGCGAVIASTDEYRASLTVSRPKERGRITDAEIQILEALVPHLARAVALHARMAETESEKALLNAHFDDAACGLLLVNRGGLVLLANSKAREVLEGANGIRLEKGHFWLTDVNLRREMQAALQRISADPDLILEPHRIVVPRDGGLSSLLVTISPGPCAAGRPSGPLGHPVLIQIIDPAAPPTVDVPLLRSLFSLTKAEARLAENLARGLTLQECADEAGVSLNTIRTHLARALDKTGTNKQAQLVALISRTASMQRPRLETQSSRLKVKKSSV